MSLIVQDLYIHQSFQSYNFYVSHVPISHWGMLLANVILNQLLREIEVLQKKRNHQKAIVNTLFCSALTNLSKD